MLRGLRLAVSLPLGRCYSPKATTSQDQRRSIVSVERTLHKLLYDRSFQYRSGSELVEDLKNCVAALRDSLPSTEEMSAGKASSEFALEYRRIISLLSLEELDVAQNKVIGLLDAQTSTHADVRDGERKRSPTPNVAHHGETVSATMTALLVNGIIRNDPKISDRALSIAGRAFKKGLMTDRVWSNVFLVLALNQCTPLLVDKWLDLYLDTYKKELDERKRKIPFQMILNGASHCVFERDIERALRWYGLSKKYAVDYSLCVSPLVKALDFMDSDAEMDPVAVDRELCDLALCGRVIRSATHTPFDGGLRDRFVTHIREHVSLHTLQSASWSVVSDIMMGLSLTSALSLVSAVSKSKWVSELFSHQEQQDSDDDSDDPARDDVPLEVWVALLRVAAGSRHIVEAEGLFNFIRLNFKLSASKRDELVETMLKLYSSLSPPDFSTLCCFFFEHVINTPPGEEPIKPSAMHFKFLMRAADSPNAASLLFYEMISRGISVNSETFEVLFRTANPSTGPISALSKQLPQDYEASPLDEQLKIPADRDAHLRREEALLSRNRKVVDSTGGV